MNQPITIPNLELKRSLERASNELARLTEIADDLDAEVNRLSKAFELEPSEDTFAKLAVTRQKSKNARAAAVEQEKATQLAQGKVKQAERNALATELHRKERAMRKRFDAALEHFAQGAAELDGAIAEFAAHHGERLATQRRGVPVAQMSLQSITSELDEKLSEFRARDSLASNTTYAKIQTACAGQIHDAHLVITIRRPLSKIPVNAH